MMIPKTTAGKLALAAKLTNAWQNLLLVLAISLVVPILQYWFG